MAAGRRGPRPHAGGDAARHLPGPRRHGSCPAEQAEVAAAIGWIGLAWLAPVWGALLYFMFGINRVVRRAQTARRPRHAAAARQRSPGATRRHLAPLERAVRRITNRTAEDGNAVAVLHDGDKAYPAMLAAIEARARSVALSTYIMRDDAVGRRFVARARGRPGAAACRSGCWSTGSAAATSPPICRRLRRARLAGGAVHAFGCALADAVPQPAQPQEDPRGRRRGRLHGRHEHHGREPGRDKPAHPVADTHFRFDGPVVAQLDGRLRARLGLQTGERLEGRELVPGDEEREGQRGPRRSRPARIRTSRRSSWCCSRPSPAPRTSIKVMTPYFLPDETIVTLARSAAMRGVKVDVVVPRRSDHRFVDLRHAGPCRPAARARRAVLARAAAVQPFQADGGGQHWCLIGSANWDMRSLRLNFELNVEIYDADIAERLEAIMTPHQQARLRLQRTRRAKPANAAARCRTPAAAALYLTPLTGRPGLGRAEPHHDRAGGRSGRGAARAPRRRRGRARGSDRAAPARCRPSRGSAGAGRHRGSRAAGPGPTRLKSPSTAARRGSRARCRATGGG